MNSIPLFLDLCDLVVRKIGIGSIRVWISASSFVSLSRLGLIWCLSFGEKIIVCFSDFLYTFVKVRVLLCRGGGWNLRIRLGFLLDLQGIGGFCSESFRFFEG